MKSPDSSARTTVVPMAMTGAFRSRARFTAAATSALRAPSGGGPAAARVDAEKVSAIIDHLVRTRKVDPDEGLSPAERAISLAFRRMVKEHLYWVLMHGRYRDPAGWAVYREVLASMFMFPGAPDEVRSEAYAAVDGIQQTVLQQLADQWCRRNALAQRHRVDPDPALAEGRQADREALADAPRRLIGGIGRPRIARA